MAVTEVRITIHPAGTDPIQIAEKIKEQFPEQVIDVANFRDQVSVIIKKDRYLPILKYLHDDPLFSFDHLQDLTAVDYLKKKDVRFEVVYNLYSIKYRHQIRIRAQVADDKPSISVRLSPSGKVPTGMKENAMTCSASDSTDIPDLRRILMPEDWEGHPLRKDYPLKGPELENDWIGFREVLKRSKELKEFEWEG